MMETETIEKTTAELILFELPNVVKFFNALCSKKNKSSGPAKKKRRYNIDLKVDDLHYQDVNKKIEAEQHSHMKIELTPVPVPPVETESFIFIASRSIRSEMKMPLEHQMLLDSGWKPNEENSSYRIELSDLVLSFDEFNLLTVANKKRVRLPQSDLLSLAITDEKVLEMVKKEVAFLKPLPVSKRSDNLEIHQPILTILISPNSYKTFTIEVTLGYKLRIKEGILNYYSSDIIEGLQKLLETASEAQSSNDDSVTDIASDRVTTPVFYNIITEAATRMAGVPVPIVPDLQVNLLPFQGKTVNWLLNKEGRRYNKETKLSDPVLFFDYGMDCDLEDPEVIEKMSFCLDKISFGWKRIHILQKSGYFWFNQYTGNIISSSLARKLLVKLNGEVFPAQGVLAEEMGLGKTVEMASLVLLNQRSFDDLDKTIFHEESDRDIKQIKTTLIIAPDSILGQWIEELQNLSPTLKIYHYEGCNISSSESPREVAESLSEYDVVLCSYQTIARELHYAQYNPISRPTRIRSTRVRSEVFYNHDYDSSMANEDNDESNMNRESHFRDTQGVATGIVETRSNDGNDIYDLNHYNSDGQKINYSGGQNSHYDYSSPLMLLQFWRVILDEVQMVTSRLSNAAKTAKMIPRVHAWGVSGTPIKKDISDLQSIMSFLKFSPFGSEKLGSKAWNRLLTKMPDFVKLWKYLALRHTKDLVADQIKLPLQKRMILSCPFTAVEQDNYKQLLERCLAAICLDQNGNPIIEDWAPTPTILSYMRQWLMRLRQVCCNAQVGKLNLNKKNHDSLPELRTVEDVLSGMIEESEGQLLNFERNLVLAKLERGSIEGFSGKPLDAIVFWEAALPEAQKKVEEIRAEVKRFEEREKLSSGEIVTYQQVDERERNLTNIKAKLRSWLGILHRFYFFIASAHYQAYNPSMCNVEDTNIADELKEPNKDDIPDDLLDEKDMVHRSLERQYYAKAELIRRELLQEPAKKVNELIQHVIFNRPDSEKVSGIELVDFQTSYPIDEIESQVLEVYFEFQEVCSQLNEQVGQLNLWYAKLCEILSQPVLETSEATGGEYNTSLDNQEKAYSYLEVLQKCLADRLDTITGKTPDVNGGTLLLSRLEKDDLSKSDFHVALNRERASIRPKAADNINKSLKNLVLKTKQLQRGLEDFQSDNARAKARYSSASMIAENMNKSYEKQKVALSLLKKEVTVHLNSVYNARIEYFKQLQQISDTVTPYNPKLGMNVYYGAEYLQGTLNKKIKDYTLDVSKTATRCRYLESLKKKTAASRTETESSVDEDDDDKFCIICRGSITIGSLTECGHQYCKDCLDMWLKNKSICPVCKTRISAKSVYSFTYTRPELKVKQISDNKSNEDMFSIYEPMESKMLNEIQSIQLKHSYGSKVDLIVQQTVWLKKQDPKAQIVVFSQWSDLLYIIGVALRQSGIKFLGSQGTLLPEFGSGKRRARYTDVNEFRKNPNITCFLLNAKAQSSGLTLVNATHVFLCEPLVNSALELQAISRVHRIGQTRPTTVWMFTIENTVEESIVSLSSRKRMDLIAKNNGKSKARYIKAKEADLTKADSVELITKTTTDMLAKKIGDGEEVSNDDLWAAFFSK